MLTIGREWRPSVPLEEDDETAVQAGRKIHIREHDRDSLLRPAPGQELHHRAKAFMNRASSSEHRASVLHCG